MRTFALPDQTPLERRVTAGLPGGVSRGAEWKTFASGEAHVHVSRVPARAIAVGRLTPGTDDVFRTLLLLDTLRRNGAKDLTLLLPYFAYERQDRDPAHGDPASARLMAALLSAAGASRVVSAEVHSGRLGKKSPIPVVDVSILPEIVRSLRSRIGTRNAQVVSPDKGGFERAKRAAEALGTDVPAAWIEKSRSRGRVSVEGFHGALRSDTAVIVDDMVDTGGTVLEAARFLRKAGVKRIFFAAVHGIFSGPAAARIRQCRFEAAAVSDTVPLPPTLRGMVDVRSAAPALISALKRFR